MTGFDVVGEVVGFMVVGLSVGDAVAGFWVAGDTVGFVLVGFTVAGDAVGFAVEGVPVGTLVVGAMDGLKVEVGEVVTGVEVGTSMEGEHVVGLIVVSVGCLVEGDDVDGDRLVGIADGYCVGGVGALVGATVVGDAVGSFVIAKTQAQPNQQIPVALLATLKKTLSPKPSVIQQFIGPLTVVFTTAVAFHPRAEAAFTHSGYVSISCKFTWAHDDSPLLTFT